MRVRLLELRDRLRALPWRSISLVSIATVAVIGVVPQLRRPVALGLSRAVLFAASPLAPGIHGFDALPRPTRVVAADGSTLARLDGGQRRRPVRVRALPTHVVHAVLAAEDEHFYAHGGVDPLAMLRAMVHDVRGDRGTQGGSTITQQLAKLNYTGSHRTVFRKLREVLYAARLERKYSKNELLERYLNQVYFGEGSYGLAAAAGAEFGTDPSRLTDAQAATLAAQIRAPSRLDPRRRPRALLARRDAVLRNMRRNGWLDERRLRSALTEPLQLAPPPPPTRVRAPHFVAYVQREAESLDALGGSRESRGKQLFSGGYTIETTLDPKSYDAAAAAARSELGASGDPATAVASVQPGDGAIRTLFGGLDPNRQFDVSSQGHRQPGSAFKPFVYLAALEAGIDPRSVFDASSPMTLDYQGQKFTVTNFEGAGGGQSSIDDGLVHSINTVFAQLGVRVRPENVVAMAHRTGIGERIRPVPAVALGGLDHGVNPLELAAAYATFAARGVYAEPYAITTIKDRYGRVVYRHEVRTNGVLPAVEAGVLNAQLERVVTEGTGTAAAIDRPVAGKTGTTQRFTNGWFVGFVPQLATAVWVGDPERDVPMTDVHGVAVSGGTFPARIFAIVMKAALANVPVQPIYTASPDELSLHPASSSTFTSASSSVPSTSSSTSSTSTITASPSTTAPPTTTPPTSSSPTTAPPDTSTTAPNG